MKRKNGFLLVTDNSKYELPLGVYEDSLELSEAYGITSFQIALSIYQAKTRIVKKPRGTKNGYKIYFIPNEEERN